VYINSQNQYATSKRFDQVLTVKKSKEKNKSFN